MGVPTARAKTIAKHYGMTLIKWQDTIGLSAGHFYNCQTLSKKVAREIEYKYPEINIDWLATGKGDMLNTKVYSDVEKYFVPLLPVAAQGCLPENFDELLKDFDYEKILCPLQNMTLAVTMNGDSMSPEYPNGSFLFAKQCDKEKYIEWGSTYVLNTDNGLIIKNIYPAKNDDRKYLCKSVNTNYADFEISLSDIITIYRVHCCLTIK